MEYPSQTTDALGFAPIGLDMPYRIIVQNNPVNRIDPFGEKAADVLEKGFKLKDLYEKSMCFIRMVKCASKAIKCGDKLREKERNYDPVTSKGECPPGSDYFNDCWKGTEDCPKSIEDCMGLTTP